MSDAFHVYPVNDWREHDITPGCWCRPAQDEESGVYIHHSMDGREDFEEGRRKPS